MEELQQKVVTLESELVAARKEPKKIPVGELHMRMQAAEARVQELEAAAPSHRSAQVRSRSPCPHQSRELRVERRQAAFRRHWRLWSEPSVLTSM
jgi:hypothetical protein